MTGDDQLRQAISKTMGWWGTGAIEGDCYPERTEKVLALIRQDRRELLERLKAQSHKVNIDMGVHGNKIVEVITYPVIEAELQHLTGLDEGGQTMSNKDEIERQLHEAVSQGKMEATELPDGRATFSMTPYGLTKAMETIAESGLPELVRLEAVGALGRGENPLVSAMATKTIAKFPAELKRRARDNFPQLWDEFADVTAQEYVEGTA